MLYARHGGFNARRGRINFFFSFFAVQYFPLHKMLLKTIKEIDFLQENFSLFFFKIEKLKIDSVRYQKFTFDIQTAKNLRTE